MHANRNEYVSRTRFEHLVEANRMHRRSVNALAQKLRTANVEAKVYKWLAVAGWTVAVLALAFGQS